MAVVYQVSVKKTEIIDGNIGEGCVVFYRRCGGCCIVTATARKLAAAAVKVGAPSWSSLIFGVMRAKKRESESYLLPTACRKQKESDE